MVKTTPETMVTSFLPSKMNSTALNSVRRMVTNNRRNLQSVKNVTILVLALLVIIPGRLVGRVDWEEGMWHCRDTELS